jgi:glucan-binding YG repeat protein
MKEIDPNACIEFIFEMAPKYAKAKADLSDLENAKNSLKAKLMTESREKTVAGQEREAYSRLQYKEHCKAIGIAIYEVETLKLQIKCAELRWETWRTQQANERQFDKMIRN